jgi:hypothetical protein
MDGGEYKNIGIYFWTALAGSEGIFYRDVKNKKPDLRRVF